MAPKIFIGTGSHSTSYVIDDKNSDGFGRGDDLTQTTMDTLGSYLNAYQTGRTGNNAFQVGNAAKATTPVFNKVSRETPGIVWGGPSADGATKFKTKLDSAQVLDSNIDIGNGLKC